MIRFASVVAALVLVSPAKAEWSVTSHKDRMTDREAKIATVQAREEDHGVSAKLTVRCLVDMLVGGLILSIDTTANFSPGRMGLRYRIDQGEVVPRFMPVNSSGAGMSQWADPDELRGAKRIRVELQPARARNLFFDFDLTGVDKALASIPCVKSRP